MPNTYHLLAPEVTENPYPIYRDMREHDPVYWDVSLDRWFLTRYADVQTLLNHPQARAEKFKIDSSSLPPEVQGDVGMLYRLLSQQMLFRDPPEQTRLRGLAAKSFTPRVIETIRTRIHQITHELLDQVQAQGQMELMSDFAFHLPAIVIAELLGVPPGDRDRFKIWSDDLITFLGTFYTTWEEIAVIGASLKGLVLYLQGIVDEARLNPQDNLLGALVLAEEQGDRLNAEELLANVVLLLAAGHETTTNLIGNGMLALLQNRDQWEKLKSDPSLLPGTVEELLRYDSPVQIAVRYAGTDMEIGGTQIASGQIVQAYLGAANRDPLVFASPDRLDITRQGTRHLSFGYGPHYCLGAALARMEAQIAIGALMERMPNMQLASEDLHWKVNFAIRGLEALPVMF